jgi:hypothetical protein
MRGSSGDPTVTTTYNFEGQMDTLSGDNRKYVVTRSNIEIICKDMQNLIDQLIAISE